MSTRKGIGSSRSGVEHEMRVARVEPEGDAPAGLLEHDVLALRSSTRRRAPTDWSAAARELVGGRLVEGVAVR